MKCPDCGNPQVLVESTPAGDKRVKCSKCGLDEVRDSQGRRLLTDSGNRGNTLLS
jgi:ribosomal protein S27E